MTFRNFYLLLAVFVALIEGRPLLAQDDEISWLDNYRDALRVAKESHKPIFLEFRCEA